MYMTVDFIMITYNGAELAIKCLESLRLASKTHKLNIIVVDNNSQDGTPALISKQFPAANVIINNFNYGYAKAVNIGAAQAKSDLMIISNSDVEYSESSIDIVIDYMQKNENCGVAGIKQFYPNGKLQASSGNTPSPWSAFKEMILFSSAKRLLSKIIFKFGISSSSAVSVEYADGAALFVRKSYFDNLAGFDEDYFFYTEEADFCYRIRQAGKDVKVIRETSILHHRGGSSGTGIPSIKQIEMLNSSKFLFCKKHLSKQQTWLYLIYQEQYCLLMAAVRTIIPKLEKKEKREYFVNCAKVWNRLRKIDFANTKFEK